MTGEAPPGPERPPLDRARLRTALVRPGSVWCDVEVVESTGSTNADVRERALAGAPGGTVLLAEEQVSGRGRLGRSWDSPARSSLAVSALLRPAADVPGPWGWLPLLAGLAVADAVAAATGADARLKWPNDVLVGGLKVAGILVERVVTPAGPAAVVGVGVNVSQSPDELPVETAGALCSLTAAPVDRTTLAVALLDGLGDRYAEWVTDPSVVATAYRGRSDTLGRRVRVLLPGERVLVGSAVDVDDEGRLVLDVAAERVPVAAGDVVHLR